MAELLVKAVSASHADQIKDERGCYKKGDIVVVVEDGHEWGLQEGPPTFVIVKVPGVARSTVENRRDEWKRVIDYEIVAQSPAQDGARFRIFQTVPGVASYKGITRAMVEGWINKWGGTVFSAATNEIRFDITIQAIYKSAGFWAINQESSTTPDSVGVVITETSYVQATGVHTATINIAASSVTESAARARITSRGGTIQSFAANVFTVTFERAAVRTMFMDAFKSVLERMLVRRRYSFSSADVDAALAAGGVVTLTAAQVVAKVIDKAA